MSVDGCLYGTRGRSSFRVDFAGFYPLQQLMFYKPPELPFALSHWMGRNLTETCPANQRSPIHSKYLCSFVCIKKVMRLYHRDHPRTSVEFLHRRLD